MLKYSRVVLPFPTTTTIIQWNPLVVAPTKGRTVTFPHQFCRYSCSSLPFQNAPFPPPISLVGDTQGFVTHIFSIIPTRFGGIEGKFLLIYELYPLNV